jgi:hypothetical protein
MAASPKFKVYDNEGIYEAACKSIESAAAIIGGIGCDGWTIRDGHTRVIWTEGVDGHAGESCDLVAEHFYSLTPAN